MTVWYCLECFEENLPEADHCASCGRALEPVGRSYEEKLIRALAHRLPDRRLLAAEILGRKRSRAAVPHLEHLAQDTSDPLLQAEAARALAAIDPANEIVRHLAVSGPAIVRAAVRPGASGR